MFAVQGFFTLFVTLLMALFFAVPVVADHERGRDRGYETERSRGGSYGGSGSNGSYGRHSGYYGGGGPRVYAEIEAGSTLVPDQGVHGAVEAGELDLDSGFVVGGAVGLRLAPYFRIEGALGYRRAEVDTFDFDGPFISESEGHVGVFSTQVNVALDLPIPRSPATPFVGAGLGFAVLNVDTRDDFDQVIIDDSSVQFAWNLTAGVAWALTQNLDVVTRYRYFETEDASENANGSATRPGSAEVEFGAHEVVLGLRMNF